MAKETKDTRSLDQLMADFSRKVFALESKVIALEGKIAARHAKADSPISLSDAAQVLGGSTSEAKGSASRLNGSKGGRPRLPRGVCDRCGSSFVVRFEMSPSVLCPRCS